MTDAEACAAEVIALHRLFETWLGASSGRESGGAFGRFEAAFAPGFAMVTPDGAWLDRAGVLAFLAGARGSRGEGFRIAIEDCVARHESAGLLLMHYVERQWLRGRETARRASALFRTGPDGPRWLFVQETWITPPA